MKKVLILSVSLFVASGVSLRSPPAFAHDEESPAPPARPGIFASIGAISFRFHVALRRTAVAPPAECAPHGQAWNDGYEDAAKGTKYDSSCFSARDFGNEMLNCKTYRDALGTPEMRARPSSDRTLQLAELHLNCCRIGYFKGLEYLNEFLEDSVFRDFADFCEVQLQDGMRMAQAYCVAEDKECFNPREHVRNEEYLGCLSLGYLKGRAMVPECDPALGRFVRGYAPAMLQEHRRISGRPDLNSGDPAAQPSSGRAE